MKKVVSVLTVFTLGAGIALAGEMPEGWAPPKPSAELEKIKSLAGTWKGMNPEKSGEDKSTTVTYKVTSGGSAVVETIDAGTSHEMVSMYHDKKGRLSMTHYCMLGNQPELDLKNSVNGKIELDMAPDSYAALKDEMHMHSLALEWMPDGQLKQTWTSWNPDGKPAELVVFKLQKTA